MAILHLNEQEFRSIISGEKPVLAEFWAPWCVYCRRIAPALEKVAQQREDSLAVVQVNIDEAPQLARELQIEVVPTMLLYKGGQIIASIVAPESKAKIDAFLQENLGE